VGEKSTNPVALSKTWFLVFPRTSSSPPHPFLTSIAILESSQQATGTIQIRNQTKTSLISFPP
jgi:hypothetical protein